MEVEEVVLPKMVEERLSLVNLDVKTVMDSIKMKRVLIYEFTCPICKKRMRSLSRAQMINNAFYHVLRHSFERKSGKEGR